MSKSIGVLALQGGFREHGAHLRECGLSPVYVKLPSDLSNCAGLIIPGGESSCLRKLLRSFELDAAIIDAVKNYRLCVWGTCAGAILCANNVCGEDPCMPLINVSIQRNIFGAQLASFTENTVVSAVSPNIQKLVYIRAPGITQLGDGTKKLHAVNQIITAAENDQILITSFHPELSETLDFHLYFLKKCGIEPHLSRNQSWDRNAWMRLG